MSVSLIILSVIILLIMFGAGQRILDSLRLNDKEALLILILICIGIIIPPIWIGEYFCFSIGGFLIPLGVSIYLLISCGWSRDLLRAFIGTLLVAGIIYGLEWILPADPEGMITDNMYIYGVVAGVVAYALGRSRRNAFVSCLFGITLAQLIQWLINFGTGTPTILGLGVGGAFGTYIVAIIISVAVSEFLGRCFQSAVLKKEEKVFNFETHTYDSVKNGKLTSSGKLKDKTISNVTTPDEKNVQSKKFAVSENTEKAQKTKSVKSTKTAKNGKNNQKSSEFAVNYEKSFKGEHENEEN